MPATATMAPTAPSFAHAAISAVIDMAFLPRVKVMSIRQPVVPSQRGSPDGTTAACGREIRERPANLYGREGRPREYTIFRAVAASAPRRFQDTSQITRPSAHHAGPR